MTLPPTALAWPPPLAKSGGTATGLPAPPLTSSERIAPGASSCRASGAPKFELLATNRRRAIEDLARLRRRSERRIVVKRAAGVKLSNLRDRAGAGNSRRDNLGMDGNGIVRIVVASKRRGPELGDRENEHEQQRQGEHRHHDTKPAHRYPLDRGHGRDEIAVGREEEGRDVTRIFEGICSSSLVRPISTSLAFLGTTYLRGRQPPRCFLARVPMRRSPRRLFSSGEVSQPAGGARL